jgi:hypothetical protein
MTLSVSPIWPGSSSMAIVRSMGMLQLLDGLPDAVVRPPAQLWSVLARSLGEQGADGRTALAWHWALAGTCPSPVTLSGPVGRPPDRGEILTEASADAELAHYGTDRGGQVMQARFVLQWLAGTIDPLPLWNGGARGLHVTDGAKHPRTRAEIEEAYSWALLAQQRHPWCDASAPAGDRIAFGWARGALDLLAWACGEASEGPLSGNRVTGRPTLYEVSLDACRAMTGVLVAREAGDPMRASHGESLMETFLWLAAWNPAPPVDRHGHLTFEDCPERNVACACSAVGECLQGDCPACWRVKCVPAAAGKAV